MLGPGLVGAEIWDQGQPISIHPKEAGYVVQSGEKRRRDFALGRACAHTALMGLGYTDTVVAKGQDGAPLWPKGVTGSITHTKGYAAAIVGETSNFGGIGIDAEAVGSVTTDVWDRLFTPCERLFLQQQLEPSYSATVLFCAKEASYKALRLNEALAFHTIEVVLQDQGFTANHAYNKLSGQYSVQDGIVLVTVIRTA